MKIEVPSKNPNWLSAPCKSRLAQKIVQNRSSGSLVGLKRESYYFEVGLEMIATSPMCSSSLELERELFRRDEIPRPEVR
jgi:hypothetical protein